jgi:phytanoyl-CoA hydroxylase
MLSQSQLDFFQGEGYLVVERVFDDADLQPVIDEVTAAIDERAEALVESGELSRTYAEFPFETRLAQISRETDKVARSIWDGRLSGPAFFNLITHPKLLDVAEQFCGEELIASSVYRLRPKIPFYDHGAVPWHQDSGYFEPYCDKSLVLTVWLPLVDATEENGCLWVLPRQHEGEVLRHQSRPGKGYLEIPESELPPGEPIPAPVPKGGVLLLTNRTPHVSFENKTEMVRWSMDLRYQSAALPTNAPITRLPNEDVPGDGVPLACYPPEADFLVRSKARPHEVLRDAAQFHRLRQSHLNPGMTHRWK